MRIIDHSMRAFYFAAVVFTAAAVGCGGGTAGRVGASEKNATTEQVKRSENVSNKVTKSDEEWRALLTPEQYRVMRECGTEAPFTGKYYNFKGKGAYLCAACGAELFDSDTKYESGSGWPSFYEPVAEEKIEERTDRSHGMVRVEVRCNKCGAHLGHVFEDGPAPTGLRYCINSAALNFVDESKKKEGENGDKASGDANEKSGE
jgi:peptide-methionine (R)-S-oxide reductase